jgi:hypothetical protein
MEPIYEQEFYDFSYGFRPGKSAHQCLNRIWKQSMNINGGYIIDMDISKCEPKVRRTFGSTTAYHTRNSGRYWDSGLAME